MIIISSSLALSLMASGNADYPVIGWENRVTIGTVSADSEDADYPASNLANPSTTPLQGWRSESTAEQYVTVTLDGLDAVDYIAVARHNFGSGEIAVTVEGLAAEEGADWEELVGTQFLGEDAPAIFRFTPAYLAGIRFKLTPDATVPQAAVLYTGALLVFEYGVQAGHTPIPYGRNRTIVTGRSEGGDFLGRIIVGGTLRSEAQINNLSPAWYRSTLDDFLSASAGQPFFWAWSPERYPNEVGYAWLTGEPMPATSHLAGYINVSFQMEGIVS